VNNYTDWQKHGEWANKKYPKTCCPGMDESGASVQCVDTFNGFYRDGCLKKLTTIIKDNISIIGGIGVGVAFVQVSSNSFFH
jgi:hypothetical protein